ncbi:MAG: single-stranded DNA-binding protein [Oscillospiraceae bacterium]|nr:single-stranded DNA-binding protein [Oscillospiraceae bacterium]
MINRITIMGRITKDLELKTTPNGISVVSFSIATDRKYKEKGTDKPVSDFFEIVAWRKTAEFICKYFGKGQLIAIDGELQTRSYADKNNVNHKVVEIVVNEAHFCGNKKNDNNNTPNGNQGVPNPNYVQSNGNGQYQDNEFNNMPADFNPFA